MSPRAAGARRWASALAGAALLALAACVTTYETAPLLLGTGKIEKLDHPELAVPLAIPIPGGATSPERLRQIEFFNTLLGSLHQASKERDLAQLEALLANFDRSDLEPAVKERLVGYRSIAAGLRYTRHAAANARLVIVPAPASAGGAADAAPMEGEAPALGAPLHLELQLPAPPDAVGLGGRDDADPAGFQIAVAIEDTFLDGSSRSSRTNDFLWLPRSMQLQGDVVLRLPIEIAFPGANAVRRDVHARVDVMPGYVTRDGLRCPVRQTAIAAIAVTQWPVGYTALAADPLPELRTVLRTFEPKLFARAYLAASATRGADRETAIELLLEQVRFGRPDQAQVAMAALRAITGVQFLVGDRDAWLAWARERR